MKSINFIIHREVLITECIQVAQVNMIKFGHTNQFGADGGFQLTVIHIDSEYTVFCCSNQMLQIQLVPVIQNLGLAHEYKDAKQKIGE